MCPGKYALSTYADLAAKARGSCDLFRTSAAQTSPRRDFGADGLSAAGGHARCVHRSVRLHCPLVGSAVQGRVNGSFVGWHHHSTAKFGRFQGVSTAGARSAILRWDCARPMHSLCVCITTADVTTRRLHTARSPRLMQGVAAAHVGGCATL